MLSFGIESGILGKSEYQTVTWTSVEKRILKTQNFSSCKLASVFVVYRFFKNKINLCYKKGVNHHRKD